MMGLSGRIALCLALAGCASTKVETTGTAERPLCRPELSALVAWTPAWRPDQKDVAGREAAAQRGIERFFAGSGCFAKTEIRRGTAASPRPAADRVILITVRELGPVIRIGVPDLLAGGTEVVLDIRILNTPADFRMHWKNGGPFVIKGVGTLEQDMAEALGAALK
jgi:hypothetical protein